MNDGKEVLKKSQADLGGLGRHLLSSAEGQHLLKVLEDLYYRGSMVGSTPEETYFNLGRREVVDFLIDLRDRAKEN